MNHKTPDSTSAFLASIDGYEPGAVIDAELIDSEHLGQPFSIREIVEVDHVYQRISGRSYVENDDIVLSDLRYSIVPDA
ncbi:MAG: hypothetical protein IJ930_09685 [Lachnospiraceae bacterium]|nr:hypothetical protein [Lachnospiraceae bacterium]